jgi:predicted dehydrogenase
MHKIIVAGCGAMSDHWIEIAGTYNDCEIVALVDINGEAANTRKQKHSLSANVYTNIAEALEKETANLVFDVTVPEAHFELVTTALKAGCHVFGEKPMSDSLENAEKMVACANETNREYFVMQNRRYIPRLLALKNFLQSQKLGSIGQISANFQLGPHFGGFREDMDSPLIADMAIHTFDMARFITGKNAVSVYSHEFNPSWSWYRGNANAVCIFEMEGGSVFDYRGSWCANGLITSWESEWRVACANGAVFYDGAEKLYYGLTDSTNGTSSAIEEIPPIPMEYEGHRACVREMFDALKNGTRPQTDCRDNINSIKMVYKAIESARTRKIMKLTTP